MNHLIWGISDFFSILWLIFLTFCKAYISIGFIVVILFLFLILISFMVVHDEFMKAICEAMEEFKLDNSTASFVIFFLILSLFILIAYPIIIIGLLQSDD